MSEPLHIDSEEALAEFRSTQFSAGSLAPIIDASSATLINGPTGIGKSWLIDDLIDHYFRGVIYKLIVVLAGLTISLLERRLVRHPVPGVVRLRPRPREDCGLLDVPWREHEQPGTTTWAKCNVCPACVHHPGCFWPTQYGAGLRPARVVFGTHQHLINNRRFLSHLRVVTKADSILLLIDEADFLEESVQVRIPQGDLKAFRLAVENADLPEGRRRAWLEPTRLLLGARTEDLRAPGWKFPHPTLSDTLAIQSAGLAQSAQFRWCGHQLFAFGKARRTARWRDGQGNIVFVPSPVLGNRTVFFAAGLSAAFLRRQLRIERVTEPFASVLCQHRDTRFYNIRWLGGAASRFGSNHPQILDLFALLLLRNLAAGLRTLLVSRKHLKRLCTGYLERRLARWGCPVTIVASSGEPVVSTDPATLPLIHYGISGVNSFEMFDAVYCLNSYHVDEVIMREMVADCEPDDLRFPVGVRLAGPGKIRTAGTFEPRHRFSSGDRIARAYHHQLEAMKVIQAVGRVRFATRPRDVITFQCGELPGISLTTEFHNLQQARQHFALPSGSEFDRQIQEREIRQLRDQGLTVSEIAQRLEVSERTVYCRLRATRHREDQS
jgi:hypothetical protein